jgi:mRNA interferase MazF
LAKRYIPDTGDIIRIHFVLPSGSKTPPYKSALILSPAAYNKRSGLIICCPITSNIQGYPFEVSVDPPSDLPAQEIAALADQPKSLDWVNSKITHHGKASPAALAKVRAKLHALLFNT